MWSYLIEGALCSFWRRNSELTIYNTNEVIIQAQKYLFFHKARKLAGSATVVVSSFNVFLVCLGIKKITQCQNSLLGEK